MNIDLAIINIIIKAMFCSVRFSIFKVCNNDFGAILTPPSKGLYAV